MAAPARNCWYGAGATLALLPGKQVPLRPAVGAGAVYKRNRPSMTDRNLNNVLKTLDGMKKEIGDLKKNQDDMKKDISQLKLDTAVNQALFAVNLTPTALLLLGVLYFMYSNFLISGRGGN
ncbi:hypothetical protein HXX76_009354 [Chlamydomonas incerta]|uniref:Uncharacterized protein n=1 Tax=Chlamydomonas incerta TaxID=51695 RepID=A0A835W0Q6_CHLIN|nr:hypothetical protein HXX76_009354 [Chlamydomonas incerta]|eukprot:KAG2431861.1 hypothetical protein HXX76_009354 [Chlamydomonas incerta]